MHHSVNLLHIGRADQHSAPHEKGRRISAAAPVILYCIVCYLYSSVLYPAVYQAFFFPSTFFRTSRVQTISAMPMGRQSIQFLRKPVIT